MNWGWSITPWVPRLSFSLFLKMGATFAFLKCWNLPWSPWPFNNDYEWPCDDISQLSQCPWTQTIWSQELKQSLSWSSSTAASPVPPWTLPLSSAAWKTVSAMTKVKKALIISVLSRSAVTKSPSPIYLISFRYLMQDEVNHNTNSTVSVYA